MQDINDFQKYLKSKRIHSLYQKHYTSLVSRDLGDIYHPDEVFSFLLKERIIFLNRIMDDEMCEMIKANLLYLESLNDELDIKIYINSGGGDVYSGLGLLDIMDYVKPDIVTINTGLAASMAAVILCYGTKGKRKALKRSRTMIHQPIGFGGMMQASDMEIEAKEINSLKKELYETISDMTNQTYDKVQKDADRDYWMTAMDAKKYGIIDEIITKRK